MKATAAKKTLLQALTRVERSADAKSTMPVLACVYLEAKDSTLFVGCADLYISAAETVAAGVDKPGEAVVNAKALLERVKAMPDGPVTVDIGKAATVLSGTTTRRFNIPMAHVYDMPHIPFPPSGEATAVIGAGVLADALALVTFSISTDETRANLNALKFELGGGLLRLVSTDGHRLTKVEVECEGDGEALVPLPGVQQLARLAASVDADEHIALWIHNGLVSAECQSKTVTVKQTDSTFPAWQQVVPKATPTTRAVVPREALADALRAVSLASSDRTGGVVFELDGGTLALTAESSEKGEASDEVPSDHQGPRLRIGFNAGYVLDVLKVLTCEEVVFGMGGVLDPLVMSPLDGGGFEAVVMPMRVGE
jgi:DNA polymerase-3 subunit beta